MNGPTDLSGGTGGRRDDDSGHLGADGRDVTRALRAALGAPQDDDEAEAPGGSAGARPAAGRPAARPVPASFLAAVERRAARLHRRRQAGALAGAAAAAVVVVAVGGLVLPQLGSMAESSSAGSAAGSSADSAAASAPAAGQEGPQTLQGSATSAAPDAASGTERFDDASAAEVAALLTAADVTAFSVPVQDAGTSDETGQQLPLTACVEGDAGAVQPLALRRTDLTADPASLPAAAAEPPGLVERVATLGSAAEGPEALARVEAQLPACTGPGLEGTGPTTQLDATPVTPVGGEALVLASTSGQGSPTLQVLLVHGSTLVQLQVTSDAPDAQTALDQLVDTARTALERATGSTSTIPARAP